jgi:MFS family permease
VTSVATADPGDLAAARSRATWTLFAGVGLASTGYIAASTIAAIVAEDLAGSAAWAGLPAAAVVIGSAVGSAVLAALMARRGRRMGLTVGYLAGAAGAAVAVMAVIAHSFPLFLAGTVVLGLANSANLLSRYAAAEMVPRTRRATALGTIVWAGTIGAVLGPNLGTLTGRQLAGAGVPELVGVYVVPLLFVTAAAVLSFVLLRPDPSELAVERAGVTPAASAATPHGSVPLATEGVRTLLARPAVATALVALVAGQVVMVLIMTMTPIHMTGHGHDIGAVGLVISGHVFGMFALSPLSGRLTDRLGALPVILAGLSVSAGSAVLAAAAPPEGGPLLFVALFLLGYGWNLGFVAGSALLASGLSGPERTRLEGVVDALIWSSAAAASLGSGVVLAVAGFTALCVLGVGLAVVPAALIVTRRRRATAAALGDHA